MEAIYDKIHAREDAGLTTIGWITGIEGVYFGGTAILIVVGVAIDTMKQAESLVLNRQYQGFMK